MCDEFTAYFEEDGTIVPTSDEDRWFSIKDEIAKALECIEKALVMTKSDDEDGGTVLSGFSEINDRLDVMADSLTNLYDDADELEDEYLDEEDDDYDEE